MVIITTYTFLYIQFSNSQINQKIFDNNPNDIELDQIKKLQLAGEIQYKTVQKYNKESTNIDTYQLLYIKQKLVTTRL